MWFRTIFRRSPAPSPETAPAPDADPLSIPGQVFSRLNRLKLHSTQHLRGAGAGQRASARRRPAADFREHRKYVAGDDFRFVDWNASARSEQVFLKQGEHPQETTIHLLIDASASMAWGSPPKRAAVVQIAAVLGYLALNGDDRLHVMILSDAGNAVEEWTLKGKGQFPNLWRRLQGLRFGGRSRLEPAVRTLARKSRGGVVFLLSDLLDENGLDAALAYLPRPAWEAAVLHTLHPAELEPGLDGEFELVDAESGVQAGYDIDRTALEEYGRRLDAWRGELELTCIRRSVLYALLSTGRSLERETIPHLLRLGLLEPV